MIYAASRAASILSSSIGLLGDYFGGDVCPDNQLVGGELIFHVLLLSTFALKFLARPSELSYPSIKRLASYYLLSLIGRQFFY